MDVGDTDGTAQHAMKINTSPNNSIRYQRAPCHADYFGISVYLFNGNLFWSNNIFLNDLCHYMVLSIGEFPGNIYTFITHGLAQASNIPTRPPHTLPSPPRLYFFQLCSSINHCYKQTLFFPILGIEYQHNISN